MTQPDLTVVPIRPGRSMDTGGGGGDNGDMERRLSELERAVEKLDDGVRALEKDVAIIKSNYATTADIQGTRAEIQASRNTVIMWIVGAVLFAQVFPNVPNVLRSLGLIP